MHASLGPVRGSQTTGSMVSKLQPDGLCTHWMTGTAAPCTGVFKPMWIDAMPDVGETPAGRYDEKSLFWQHELLHREVLQAYDARMAAYRSDRDGLEEKFLRETDAIANGDAYQRQALAGKCFSAARVAEEEWLEKVSKVPPERQRAPYSLAWRGFNRQAGLQGKINF
jgi:dipeptidase